MLLELLVSRAGDRFAQSIGDEIEADLDEAYRLVNAGQAKPLTKEDREALAQYQPKAPKRVSEKPANVSAKAEIVPETKPAIDHVPVEELDLDDSTIKVLRTNGLETAEAVRSHPDLTKIKGIGKETAAKILQAVNALTV